MCKSYGFDQSSFFTFKSFLSLYPERTCLILFVVTIVIFSIQVRIFEMPFLRAQESEMYDSYSKAVWLTVVSLFTIGYGDLYPKSDIGKLVISLLAFWGAILLALVVVACSNVFCIEGKQKVALKQMQVTNKAAVAIKAALKYFLVKKKMKLL